MMLTRPKNLRKGIIGLFSGMFVLAGLAMTLHSFASTATVIVGDVNHDSLVNVLDLSLLLGKWDTNDPNSDINHDGTVNIFDLSLLLHAWGATGAPATPVSTNTPSPLPPTAVPTPSPGSGSAFVKVCGMQLCLNGQPFVIHGATAYGTYSNPATEVALAQKANINTLAIVEFETHYHLLSDTMSEATWSRVDNFIAAAKQAGLHVVLTTSSYAQSLQAAGQTPTTTDWQNYLSFIANRTNTVTHVQYKNDPTIAMVQIWGEICYPGESDSTCPAGTSGTATDMQNFYHRTITEWQALAPNILISTGGFSHINTTNSSGIPWQAIVSDPANPICELEVNSPGDVTGAVNKFTSYCKSIGKPWYLAAWSSCYQDTGYPYYLATDADMANHAKDMFNLAHGQYPSVLTAIGSEFWNLRDIGVSAGHCDIGPAYPLTFSAIQTNSP